MSSSLVSEEEVAQASGVWLLHAASIVLGAWCAKFRERCFRFGAEKSVQSSLDVDHLLQQVGGHVADSRKRVGQR